MNVRDLVEEESESYGVSTPPEETLDSILETMLECDASSPES
ncbi:MAG: hypothetical protein U5K37_10490 [Natrialbaceae archaeon]|nr:hypothetical protein [Natrialbaceae archaeon]